MESVIDRILIDLPASAPVLAEDPQTCEVCGGRGGWPVPAPVRSHPYEAGEECWRCEGTGVDPDAEAGS